MTEQNQRKIDEKDIAHLYGAFSLDHDVRRANVLTRLQGQSQPQPARKNLMVRRIVLLAVSTAVAAIVIGIFASASSEISFAQVMQNVSKQLWIHEKCSDGRESWQCPEKRIYCWKEADGSVKFSNDREGVFMQYWAGNNYISETRWQPQHFEQRKESSPAENAENKAAPKASDSSQSTETREPAEPNGKRVTDTSDVLDDDFEEFDGEIKPLKDVVDGREFLRYDFFETNALDERLLREQQWVDPKTHLPVRSRKWKTSIEVGQKTRQFVDGTFEFPETGPESIYDVGVSRDLPIVAGNSPPPPLQTLSPEFLKIVDGTKQAWERFPAQFRLLEFPAVDEETVITLEGVERIYWKGNPGFAKVPGAFFGFADWGNVRIRHERIPLFSEQERAVKSPREEVRLGNTTVIKQELELSNTEAAETWAQTRQPDHWQVFDGKNTYSTFGGENTLFVHRIELGPGRSGPNFNNDLWPRTFQWPHLQYITYTEDGILNTLGEFQILDPPPEHVPGTIALRVIRVAKHGADTITQQHDYYLDPTHDYICRKHVRWKQDETSVVEQIVELSELKQFESGQWYATRKIKPHTSRDRLVYEKRNIDIQLLDDNEFPEGIFDGEKIVKEAEAAGLTIDAR